MVAQGGGHWAILLVLPILGLIMRPVIQQEMTGCAIVSATAVTVLSYGQARDVANNLGIYAKDQAI